MYTRVPAMAAMHPHTHSSIVIPKLCVYLMTVVGVTKIPVPVGFVLESASAE